MTRAYRDVQGREVNLSECGTRRRWWWSPHRHGGERARNVVVVDLLPGGFEIENPALRSRGDLGFDPPGGFNPAYQDIPRRPDSALHGRVYRRAVVLLRRARW